MIWCIKTYIIAYVKTQKNKIHYDVIVMIAPISIDLVACLSISHIYQASTAFPT